MTPFAVRRRGRAMLRRVAVRADSNFKFSFWFLSAQQRTGLEAVYGFCREIDDLVDERPHGPAGVALARTQLDHWQAGLEAIYDARPEACPKPELGAHMHQAIETFRIPRTALEEILEGCRMDLEHASYPDLAALDRYAYRVASCVGFACLPVFGDTSPEAHRFAHNLGIAMQYTNILRDVGEDAAEGRVYLPEQLIHACGLESDELKSAVYDRRFIELAERFSKVAREHFRLAWSALDRAPRRRRLVAAEIMGRTYEAILNKLEARNWDVFTRRVKIRRRDKLRIAAACLARAGISPPTRAA